MPEVVFILPDASERRIDAPTGSSLMLAAVRNNVRGIDAECGGCLSCATCHVWIDEADAARVPPAPPEEADMLEFAAAGRRPTSRLSCQIEMTEALAGLRVHVPDTQG